MASAVLAQACQSLSWPGDPQTGSCTPNALPKAGRQPSLAARAHRLLFSSLLTRRHFLQSCFRSPWLPTQTAAQGYPVPHAALHTCLGGIPAVPGTAAFQPIIPPSLVPSSNSLEGSQHPTTQLVNEQSQQCWAWKQPVMDAGITLCGADVLDLLHTAG